MYVCVCVCIILKILTSHSQTIRKRSPTEPRQEPQRWWWWWWLVVVVVLAVVLSVCVFCVFCPDAPPTMHEQDLRTEVAAYCSVFPVSIRRSAQPPTTTTPTTTAQSSNLFHLFSFYFYSYQLKRCSKLTCCTSVCVYVVGFRVIFFYYEGSQGRSFVTKSVFSRSSPGFP